MKHTWLRGKFANFSLDNYCESLSLACGNNIRWQYSWRELGDIREFCSIYGGISFTNTPTWSTTAPLTQEQFEQAKDIHELRNAIGQSKPSLGTAIRRWVKSKSAESSFLDQFIDLRIALEALYLDSPEGELRFRLATHGSWHIGKSVEERKRFYQILLQMYKLASNAVHGGDIKKNKKNEELLNDAQDLCHKGILKRLKEEARPKWGDLILGG